MNSEIKKQISPKRKNFKELKGMKVPKSVEAKYRNNLVALTKMVQKDIVEEIISLFDKKYVIDSSVVVDGTEEVLFMYTAKMRQLREKYEAMKPLYFAAASKMGVDTSRLLKKRFYSVLKQSTGVQPDLAEIVGEEGIGTALEFEVENNVNLIKSIPTAYLDRVNTLVKKNYLKGGVSDKALVEELLPLLRKELRELGPKAIKRAKLIARDQTSKIAASLDKVRQTNLGIEEYIWSNSKDRRVRGNPSGLYPDVPKNKNHWDREGQVFRWDSPPADGHPGEAINCRCIAIPVIKKEGIDTKEIMESVRNKMRKK